MHPPYAYPMVGQCRIQLTYQLRSSGSRSNTQIALKRLKEWFAQGRVTLDGEVITKPHLRLEDPGKRLSMGKPQQVPNVVFKRLPIRIHAQVNLLYIDNSLAIVNKGPGLLSVPLPGKNQPSALKILESYFKGKGASELERNRVDRATLTPLPVHRLDQYTSGLLCFAMTPQAREHLVKQVRDHSFIREYMALADGWVDPRRGTWRSWFKLDKEGMQQAVFDEPTEGATEAISHYEVIDSISWPTRDGKKQTVSRLKLRLETGLKHQLRIHSARAGCPLLGDRHYNPDFKKPPRPTPDNPMAVNAKPFTPPTSASFTPKPERPSASAVNSPVIWLNWRNAYARKRRAKST